MSGQCGLRGIGERTDNPRDQNASPPSESVSLFGPRDEWRNMRSDVGPPSWKRSLKWVLDVGDNGCSRPERNVSVVNSGCSEDRVWSASAESEEVASRNGDGVDDDDAGDDVGNNHCEGEKCLPVLASTSASPCRRSGRWPV